MSIEKKMDNNMPNSKAVLITGASSGFGLVTSNLLASLGYRVFGTSRNPSKPKDGGELSHPAKGVEMLELDVTSDESVNECVNTMLQRTDGRLDVLVNNAGIVILGGIEETSLEEAKKLFETNFFGCVRMVRAVLPIMRRQGSGQIINIGSLAGHIAVPFQGYYATSKFALEGFTESLRFETKRLGIKVSIVEPGFFKTNLARSAGFASMKIGQYDHMRENSLNELRRREEKGGDPRTVAETILRVIETDAPKLHYPVGRDRWGLLFKRLLPQTIFEGQVRRIFKLDD